MAYQLSDIISRVQRRIRDTGYSASEITDYLNDTVNDIYNEYRLPFMQTQVDLTVLPGQLDISSGAGLPVDYVQAVDVINTVPGQESQLLYTSYEEMNSRYPDFWNTTIYPPSIPTRWTYWNNNIYVFPAPRNATPIRLHYWKKPTLLSVATDVPQVPSEFVELLVLGAAYRVLQVKDNYDQAGVLQNKYDEQLQKMVVKYSVPQTGHATQMRISREANIKMYF